MGVISAIFQAIIVDGLYKGSKRLYNGLKRLHNNSKDKRSNLQNMKALCKQAQQFEDIANDERKLGNMTTALQFYSQAEQTYEEANDTNSQANVLMKMSILENIRENNCEKARFYYDKARLVVPTRNNQHIELKMGAISSRWGKYDFARTYYEKAESICQNVHDDATLANVLRLRGILEGKPGVGDISEARECLKKSYTIYERLNDEDGQAKIFQALGDIERENDDYRSAVKNYNKAYCLYKQINDIHNESILMGELYRIYALLGEQKDAQAWEKRIEKQYNEMSEKTQNYIDSCLRDVSHLRLTEQESSY